ncbi:TIGR02301 family protein [Rhodobacteraceae bacterium RKSG542]|nr:TIGR02301 family protein [Pseudovibrio flavus]MTI18717.1 TIGR02301 family protein [Pseudovibrio flavus]
MIVFGLISLFGLGTVHAQETSEGEPAQQQESTEAEKSPTEQLEALSPPYEKQLMRLAEILGGLHYLRPLCGHSEANEWSGRMQALLDAEVKNELRRRRFVERFNQGYRGFAAVYRRCTASAMEASRRYAFEGAEITRDVTARYSRE